MAAILGEGPVTILCLLLLGGANSFLKWLGIVMSSLQDKAILEQRKAGGAEYHRAVPLIVNGN